MSNYNQGYPYQNYQRPQPNRNNFNPQMNNDMINNHFSDLAGGMDDFEDPIDNFFGGNFGMMRQNMMTNFFIEMNFGFGNGMINHQMGNIGGNGNQGTVFSKSYVQKIDYSSGQPVKESYQSQSIKQYDKEGHNINEKQEVYKNSSGVEKAAQQRLLDNRGQKCIKQRNRRTGEQEVKNIYKGMNEDQLDDFNKQYDDYRQKSNFQKNYQLLGRMNNNQDNRRMIGNGQRRGVNPQIGG